MDVRIRLATEADLDGIQRIYNQAILETTATWDEAPWTMAQRREWFAEHEGDCPVLVAEGPAGVIGFAGLSLMSKKSGWRFTRENTIYIDPAWHRKGVGRLLLQALLDEAERLGLHLVVASITSDNEASIALHRAFGFEVVGTLNEAGWKFGQRHSTTYMQRVLNGDR
jgi:phosphinothricin acetyltransferase